MSRRLVRGLACGACVTLAACGGGSDAGPTAQTITIHLSSTTNLALIAFRDGPNAPWQTPTATAPGRYEIAVHGPYTVEHVCAVSDFALTLELLRTPDDPHDLELPCLGSGSAPAPALSHVTGSMGTFGFISVGPKQALTGADGQFDVQITDGTYDVIARSPSVNNFDDLIAIRRNMVVAGDTMVTPAIDVAAEGTATVFVRPTVANLMSNEVLSMSGVLTTPTASSSVNYPDILGVHVLPDAALGPHDAQSIAIDASVNTDTKSSSRAIKRRYTAGTSVLFTLPLAMTEQYTTAGSQQVVTWTTLPPFDELQFRIGQEDVNSAGLLTEHDVKLSATYVAATGVTSAAFDTDVPGYDPAWRTDITRLWWRDAQARRVDGGDTITSFHGEDITP
jgi:hypothetical protein